MNSEGLDTSVLPDQTLYLAYFTFNFNLHARSVLILNSPAYVEGSYEKNPIE